MKRTASVIAISALLLTACGNSGPVQLTPNEPVIPAPGLEKIPGPENYPAVFTYCSHGSRVFQSFYSGGSGYGTNSSLSLAVVPNDPTCHA